MAIEETPTPPGDVLPIPGHGANKGGRLTSGPGFGWGHCVNETSLSSSSAICRVPTGVSAGRKAERGSPSARP